jgi:membrane-associated HD superfamily phosphohydrolase
MFSYASVLKNSNRPRRFFNSKKMKKKEEPKIIKPIRPRAIKTEWADVAKKQVNKPIQKITEKPEEKKQKKVKINYEKLIIQKYKENEEYNNWVDENIEQLEDLYFRFCKLRENLNEEKFYITMYLNKDNLVW